MGLWMPKILRVVPRITTDLNLSTANMQINWVIWYTEVDLRILFRFKGDYNESYEVVLVKVALPWSTTLGMLPVLAAPLVYAELGMNINRTVRPLRVKSGVLVFFCSFSFSLSLSSNCLCMPTRCLSGKNQVDWIQMLIAHLFFFQEDYTFILLLRYKSVLSCSHQDLFN